MNFLMRPKLVWEVIAQQIYRVSIAGDRLLKMISSTSLLRSLKNDSAGTENITGFPV